MLRAELIVMDGNKEEGGGKELLQDNDTAYRLLSPFPSSFASP
jgi:hypothetical protein